MLATTTVLADGWHHGHIWWPILWLLVLALLFLFAARRGWFRGGSGGAKTILAERYARGEISADEYRERLANLR